MEPGYRVNNTVVLAFLALLCTVVHAENDSGTHNYDRKACQIYTESLMDTFNAVTLESLSKAATAAWTGDVKVVQVSESDFNVLQENKVLATIKIKDGQIESWSCED